VHVLAAYVPQHGVVLAQMRVEEKSNEITHAPKLLKQLDLLCGKIMRNCVWAMHRRCSPC
jgi:hypothetical protein